MRSDKVSWDSMRWGGKRWDQTRLEMRDEDDMKLEQIDF